MNNPDAEGSFPVTTSKITVKDSSDYSEVFITGLEAIGYKHFELKDSFLIINDLDTALFPKTPEIGKRIVLTGKKDELAVSLMVKRLNYTTIDYTIEMVEFGKTNHLQKGRADIVSGFFLGGETDESDISGLSYFVTEFNDYGENGCYTHIRLGYEEESGPHLLGKLVKNCNGDINDADLDGFPTLTEK